MGGALPRRGVTVWLTGLPAAGKSTIATCLQIELARRGYGVEVLDGDVVRRHLSKGLGFSREDRDENIRRIAFVCQLITRQRGVVIAAAISPYRVTRAEARNSIGNFVEVYVRCPLEEAIRRDPKGLYARALRGEIKDFTGISDPYEAPEHPEVVVDTDRQTVAESTAIVMATLERLGYLAPVTAASLSAAAAPDVGGGVQATSVLGDRRDDATQATLGLGAPHGGSLVNRLMANDAAGDWHEQVAELPQVRIDDFARSDLELLGNGGFSPLTGFMGSADYRQVIADMRLANGTVWPMPIVLGVADDVAAGLQEGKNVALVDHMAQSVGILELAEKYRPDLTVEAQEVYRTTDADHPGVGAVHKRGPTLLAGSVKVMRRQVPPGLERYWLSPVETRRIFQERGWRTVVGFQTRNPVHRAHEYIQKAALETVDGLLLHPLVGETKADDLPAEIRLRCYEVLLEQYFPSSQVLLSALPAAMRYAGPREAIFHALVRKNFGCTHFIVGRDHAGVGNYYGTYDAQRIFDGLTEADLGIRPMFFDHAFYCRRCAGMASRKTCGHDSSNHVILSGTQVRMMLERGEELPPEFTRPEVAEVLTAYAREVH
ncbi:MAG: sulfate adenylyltransferase [Dehalococcoidia bacterium]|nr:sulfate adenylyltransferase [Dehalococcoidia bacterium]